MNRSIVLASQNTGKLSEMKALLIDYPCTLLSASEAGYTQPIVENGLTFTDNARIKAEAICQALDCWAVADDSGLEVDYLGGQPGVFSARYSRENASDRENNEKLLAELRGVQPENRRARFVSIIALSRPNEDTVFFEGICEGTILLEPDGAGGFGYDPLFLPDGESLSFAAMAPEDKNAISHRGKAMRLLRGFLLELQ